MISATWESIFLSDLISARSLIVWNSEKRTQLSSSLITAIGTSILSISVTTSTFPASSSPQAVFVFFSQFSRRLRVLHCRTQPPKSVNPTVSSVFLARIKCAYWCSFTPRRSELVNIRSKDQMKCSESSNTTDFVEQDVTRRLTKGRQVELVDMCRKIVWNKVNKNSCFFIHPLPHGVSTFPEIDQGGAELRFFTPTCHYYAALRLSSLSVF